MDTLSDLCERAHLRLIFVYLAEAHALDTWPLSSGAPASHSTIEERLEEAKKFLAGYPRFASLVDGHWYIDALDDETTRRNGLWPERYLLLDGAVVRWSWTLSYEERYRDIPEALQDAVEELWGL